MKRVPIPGPCLWSLLKKSTQNDSHCQSSNFTYSENSKMFTRMNPPPVSPQACPEPLQYLCRVIVGWFCQQQMKVLSVGSGCKIRLMLCHWPRSDSEIFTVWDIRKWPVTRKWLGVKVGIKDRRCRQISGEEVKLKEVGFRYIKSRLSGQNTGQEAVLMQIHVTII